MCKGHCLVRECVYMCVVMVIYTLMADEDALYICLCPGVSCSLGETQYHLQLLMSCGTSSALILH